MTPDQLAEIHARAMTTPPSWDADTFRSFLDTPNVFLVTARAGFALGRVTLDEAELLTLAIDPERHRMGLGRICLTRFELAARAAGATRAFLEVAESNDAAHALYTSAGWIEDGRREGYYKSPDGNGVAAILMSKPLI